ncbi:MAG: hypothetical protein ACRD09_01715 [Vicinamibacterales bacterium]
MLREFKALGLRPLNQLLPTRRLGRKSDSVEDAVNSYEATFGSMVCHVNVEARSNVHGEPVSAATPFVLIGGQSVLYWFPNSAGEPTEFLDGTEDDALAQAAKFLTERLGHQNSRFTKAPDRTSPVVLKPLKLRSN